MPGEPYVYPATPHARRHGPLGYLGHRAFKPWLRDEFSFRCVYCLVRERWYPNGQDSFSIDHWLAQALAPERVWDYENLLYACLRCNSWKQASLLPDPSTTPYGNHLLVRDNGVIEGLTQEGARLIEVLKLDDPQLTSYRRRLLDALRLILAAFPNSAAARSPWLGFPEDLPDLAVLRPPGSNSRPAGVAQSYFAMRQRGELPPLY
jgi:hypothetical protein